MVPCLFRIFFGIPCPGCGITRALFSLFCGNLAMYFFYNAFALPLLLVPILFIFEKYLKLKIFKILCLIIVFSNFIYYLIRLFFFFIP